MDLSDDTIRRLAAWAASHPTVSDLWLFGSRARGDHRPDSDIDLAIRMTGEKGLALGLYLAKGDRWQADLADLAGYPVSLQILVFTREFDDIVDREGIWLWSRDVAAEVPTSD